MHHFVAGQQQTIIADSEILMSIDYEEELVMSVCYFTPSALLYLEPRRWLMALIAYEKLIVPVDLEDFTTISESDKDFADFKKGVRSTTISWDESLLDSENVFTLGVKADVCHGDQAAMNELQQYLLPIINKNTPFFSEAVSRLIPLKKGTIVLPHVSATTYLLSHPDRDKWNCFDFEIISGLQNIFLTRVLQASGEGTWMPGFTDWLVLSELLKAPPMICIESERWMFRSFIEEKYISEVCKNVLLNSKDDFLELLDDVLTLEVPSFEGVPIGELLKIKRKDRLLSLTQFLRKALEESKPGMRTLDYVRDLIHEMLWDIFDRLKPTKKSVTLGMLGNVPLGPIPLNPIGLFTAVDDIKTFMQIDAKFDWLLTLMDLRRVAQSKT
ncbi:hypothetical protein H8E77_22215 [bacterium]|nr:hypothetical protein [bacterium]